jgi:UDP-GlcNAc3NAcA epimerase
MTQKESYFWGKKCIVLRNTTEWIELVENGWAVLCECEMENIILSVNHMKNIENNFNKQLYGNGKTAINIIEILLSNSQHRMLGVKKNVER